MLVPDHFVRKGQHSTFDDSWTRSYLRAWEKFAGKVTNSIILVICVHTRLFCEWKLWITNLSRRSSWARNHVTIGERWHWDNPRTDFGRGDVQQPPISRSYLRYWAYRMYIGEWSDCYGYRYIYIYISSGGGRRLPVKPYFFPFFISHSQYCLKIVYPAVNKTNFIFLNKFSIQTPLWLSLNSLDKSIFTWYFPFEIMNICHLLTIILTSETGWSDAHTLLNTG